MDVTGQKSLLDLPEELIVQILDYLPAADLVFGVRQTCRQLHDVSRLPCLWRRVSVTCEGLATCGVAAGRCPQAFYSGLLGQKCSGFQVRALELVDPAIITSSGQGQGHDGTARGGNNSSGRGDIAMGGVVVSREVKEEEDQEEAEEEVVEKEEEEVEQEEEEEKKVEKEEEEQEEEKKEEDEKEEEEQKEDDEEEEEQEDDDDEEKVEQEEEKEQEEEEEKDPDHDVSGAAGSGALSTVWVEKDLKSVARSLHERIPFSSRLDNLSITTGVVYPNLRNLSLSAYSPPDTAFLSQHRTLRSLRIFSSYVKDYFGDESGFSGVDKIRTLFENLGLCESLKTLQLDFDEVDESMRSVKTLRGVIKDYFVSGPVLTSLRLGVPVNDDIVRTILDRCSHLKDLQLSNTHLTVRAFRNVVTKTNSSLSAIRLKGCPFPDNKMVHAISKGFRQLKELELSFIVTPESTSEKSRWLSAVRVALDLPGLTDLKLSLLGINGLTEIQRSVIKDDVPDASDSPSCVELLTRRNQPIKGKLQHLEISQAGSVVVLPLQYSELFSLQPDLRSVNLAGSGNTVSDESLETLAKTSRQLQFADLSSCRVSLTGLSFLSMLPHLEEVRCSIHQSKGSFRPPADWKSDPELAQESRLRCLALKPWRDVPLDYLSRLATQCPGLTDLTITGCCNLTDGHVGIILRSFPYLRDLHLDTGVTGKDLHHHHHVPQEQTSALLTDQCLQDVLTYGTELRTVRLLFPGTSVPTSLDVLARTVVHAPSLIHFTITLGSLCHHLDDFAECSQGHDFGCEEAEQHVVVSVNTTRAAVKQELEKLGDGEKKKIIALLMREEARSWPECEDEENEEVEVIHFGVHRKKMKDVTARNDVVCFIPNMI